MHELLARASAWLWPALANHLWQATLFAALVFGVTLLLRGGPARLRYALWLVAAAKFAVPSALFAPAAGWLGVGSLWRAEVEPGVTGPLFLRITEPVAADAPELVVGVSGARTHEELLCVLTVVWLVGCAALVAVWLRRRREFRLSLREGTEAWAGREFEALGRARARLGMKRDVLLVLSQGRTEPGVWRTLRPVLLLPSEVASQLDDEELEAVVLHELAHVERRDNLFANLQTALACVFWFNPAVWLIGRRLFTERESACDERVVEVGGAVGAYAAGILKVVRFCSGWRVAGVAGVASGSNLRRRIEMIMRGERRPDSGMWRRVMVSGVAAAAVALTVGAGLYGGAREVSARMLEGAGGEPQEGGRAVARVRRRQVPGPAVKEIEQAAEGVLYIEQTAGAPVAVTDARIRMITREQLARAHAESANSFGDEQSPLFLTLPTVTVSNSSSRAVREVGVGFEKDGRTVVVMGYAVKLKPGESEILRSSWYSRNAVLPGTFADVKVRVVWASFDDGTQWGVRASPPHPPAPPAAPDAPDPGTRAGVVSSSDARGVVSAGQVAEVYVGAGSGSASGQGEGSGEGPAGRRAAAPAAAAT